MSEFADVLIRCPIPGNEHLEAERLEDFLQTEIGQRVLGASLENIKILREAGMGEEQALTIALGAAAVRDEDGKLMRRSAEEGGVIHAPELEATASKKKLR